MRRKVLGTVTGQKTFVTAILSSVTTMHIKRDLTKEMYTRFDYLGIAAALLPSHRFKNEIRKELLRIAQAREEDNDDKLKEFWDLKENALHSMLAKTGIDVQALFKAPKKKDPYATRYCPMCLNEYITGSEKCKDCGVYLEKFY